MIIVKTLNWIDGYDYKIDYYGIIGDNIDSLFCHIKKYDTGWHCYIEIPLDDNEVFDKLEDAKEYCQKQFKAFIESCFDSNGKLRELQIEDSEIFIEDAGHLGSWCEITSEDNGYGLAYFDYIGIDGTTYKTQDGAFKQCLKAFKEFIPSCLIKDGDNDGT